MRICLIGTTHPSHNPRLVREADTLSELGYDVFVISPSFIPKMINRDKELLEERKWNYIKYDFAPTSKIGKLRFLRSRITKRLFKILYDKFKKMDFAEKSFVFAFNELLKIAKELKADWYIAHTQGALPIGYYAALINNAKLGYDCEDLLSENDVDPKDIVTAIENEYIDKCNYISTPSNLISKYLIKKYKINNPIVLYNVFPVNLAKDMTEPQNRHINKVLKVHWMSQVIGPERGLQQVIKANGRAGGKIELYLRGSITAKFKNDLKILASKNEVKIYFLPQIKHDEIISSMEKYDIGLATETGNNKNFSMTVTNKIFSYMLAGLAVIATKTPGQIEVLGIHSNISYLYEHNNIEELVEILRRIKDDPIELHKKKQESWNLARNKYSWDIEKRKFLSLLN